MKTTDLYDVRLNDIPTPVLERFKKLFFDLGSLEAILKRAPHDLGRDYFRAKWELHCHSDNEAIFVCEYGNASLGLDEGGKPDPRCLRVRRHILVRRLQKEFVTNFEKSFDVV